MPRENQLLTSHCKITSFCDDICRILVSTLSVCKEIPREIILLILTFSNHQNIQLMWIRILKQLQSFSYMIQGGESLMRIQEFEAKCAQMVNDVKYELPSDLRISLMLSNGSRIPPLFTHCYTKDQNQTLSQLIALETYMLPLTEWEQIDNFVFCIGLYILPYYGVTIQLTLNIKDNVLMHSEYDGDDLKCCLTMDVTNWMESIIFKRISDFNDNETVKLDEHYFSLSACKKQWFNNILHIMDEDHNIQRAGWSIWDILFTMLRQYDE